MKFPSLFSHLLNTEKRAGNFKTRKKHGLESYFYVSFPQETRDAISNANFFDNLENLQKSTVTLSIALFARL